MMGGYNMIILLAFLVDGVFSADTDEVMPVMEGDSVTLKSGISKNHNDIMRWYFNNALIALINGDPNTSCLYDGEDGRFRDRLKVDYETGSLTITNIRPEHAGRYEAELIRIESSGKSESLNRNRKCDSTKIIPKSSSSMDKIIKTFNVTVKAADPQKDLKEPETDKSSGLSSGAVAGIVVAVVLLVSVAIAAAGVIYYCHRSSRKDDEKMKPESLEKFQV